LKNPLPQTVGSLNDGATISFGNLSEVPFNTIETPPG
jgi:hypothetical protein